MAPYVVYIAQFRSMPVFHEAIYIESRPGKGWMYHVAGGHGPGWQYETKKRDNIESSRQYYKKHRKGTLDPADLDKVGRHLSNNRHASK